MQDANEIDAIFDLITERLGATNKPVRLVCQEDVFTEIPSSLLGRFERVPKNWALV